MGNLRSFGCDFRESIVVRYTTRIAETSRHCASSGHYHSTPTTLTPTLLGHSTTQYCHHASHDRRPRAPSPPLVRSSLYQNPRIHPDSRTLMLFPHMRLANPISHIGIPKAQRKARKPCHEAREQTADPRHESAQLGQEAV
jgi:hypothetical protein